MVDSNIIKYLSTIDDRQRLLEFDGIRLKGTKALYDRGIKVCQDCGTMLPIERNNCKCGAEVWCDYVNVGGAPEALPMPKARRRQKGEKVNKGVIVI